MASLVFLEHHGGEIQKGALGVLAKAVSLADLGVDPGDVGESGSRTSVRAVVPPPAKSDQVKLEDDGSGAEKIVDYLAEKRLI